MSLTSFLQQPDVRQRFREEFALPKLAKSIEMPAPPRSTRYALVGTAFDYLLRFYVQRLNPCAVTSTWIAERVANILRLKVAHGRHDLLPLAEQAQQIVQQAQHDYEAYLATGQLTDQLLASVLRLAQLDPIFRAGVIDRNLGNVFDEDIADLHQLISIVEPRWFTASRLCLLNPTFGAASLMVGGADADMVIDEMIIEVKTTKSFKLERDHFHQLIGYYILHEIAGVDSGTTGHDKPAITKLGVYFARFGYLYSIAVRDVIRAETFPSLLDWFVKRAKPNALR